MDDQQVQIQQICDKYARNNVRLNGVKYRLMQPSDVEQIAYVGSTTYCNSEPCTKRVIDRYPNELVRLQREQREWLISQTHSQSIHHTSVVATIINPHTNTEQVIAFSQSFPQPPADDDNTIPDLVIKPVIQLMTQLKAAWLQQWSQSPDRTLLIQDLAVSDEWNGHGVATDLVQITVDIARSMQYNALIAEASSASQNVFLKAQFQSANNIVYNEFVYDGERMFADIAPFSEHYPVPAAHLMYRKLDQQTNKIM